METIALNKEKRESIFFLRTSFQGNPGFYFLIIFLFLSGLTLLFNLSGNDAWYGLAFTMLSVGLFFLLQSLNVNHRSFYSVTDEELILKRGNARRVIRLADIREVKVVGEEEARGEVNKYHLEEMNLRNSLDSVEYFRANRRLGKFTAYFTAPIVFSGEYNSKVTRLGNNLNDEFVLLKSASGTHLLLSPRDPKAFVEKIKNHVLV